MSRCIVAVKNYFTRSSKYIFLNRSKILGGVCASLITYGAIKHTKSYFRVAHCSSVPNEIQSSDEEEYETVPTEMAKNDDDDPLGSVHTIFKDENILKEIPHEIPYLIIGGGAAGASAAVAIRCSDPLAKIIIVNSESKNEILNNSLQSDYKHYLPYRRDLLSKILWKLDDKDVNNILDKSKDSKDKLRLYLNPMSFYVEPEELNQCKFGGVAVLNGYEVTELDPEARTVKLKGIDHKIKYEACLLATGGKPKRLVNLEKTKNTNEDLCKTGEVTYFRSLSDFMNLRSKITKWKENNESKRIVIIGAGLLGTELAWSLTKFLKSSSIEVIQVYREKSHLNHLLPAQLSNYVSDSMKEHGVELKSSYEAINIERTRDDDDKLKINICQYDKKDQKNYYKSYTVNVKKVVDSIDHVDHVIIASGIEPNTDLASKANLELASEQDGGGYLSNPELEIRPGLYVAGDAASFYDPSINKRRRIEHWLHARETGNIAGINMAAQVLSRKIRDGHYGDGDSSLPNWREVIRPDMSYVDVLKKKTFKYDSEFYFNLADRTIVAVGEINSKLKTRSIFTTDFISDKDRTMVVQSDDPLNMPGIVFYMSENNEIIGALLWNCDNDVVVYNDSDFHLLERLNMARLLISKKPNTRYDEDRDLITKVAPLFDLGNYMSDRSLMELYESMKSDDGNDDEIDVEKNINLLNKDDDGDDNIDTLLPRNRDFDKEV